MKIKTKLSRKISFLGVFFLLISLIPGVQAQNVVTPFSRNLAIGSKGEDVQRLQQFLNTHNFPVANSGLGSLGYETSYFGSRTRAALMLFQQLHAKEILNPVGLQRPTGNFYASTRNFINQSWINVSDKINSIEVFNNPEGLLNSSNISKQIISKQNNGLSYSIGGIIDGMTSTVVLQNNNEKISIDAKNPGKFKFPTKLSTGMVYDVKIIQSPNGQTCYIGFVPSKGVVKIADVNDIQIKCTSRIGWNPFTTMIGGFSSEISTPPAIPAPLNYSIGGNISGLSGVVVLQNNGGDDLSINADGQFTFSTSIVEGSPYNVTVLTQPAAQTCNVTNGSGTMGGANVTNVSVNCVSNLPRFAYITNNVAIGSLGDPTVSLCAIDQMSGLITSCQSSGGDSVFAGIFANGIVLNHTGTEVFLNSQDGLNANVYQCSVNPLDGTFSSCTATLITSPGYYANYGFLTLNPNDTIAYLVDGQNGKILACPIVSDTISGVCSDTGATNIDDSIVGIVLNKAGTTAYIGNYDGFVTTCSVSGPVFSSCVQYTGGGAITFAKPAGLALNDTETILYITDYISNQVYACSPDFSNCSVAANIPVAYGIALNNTDSLAYITNFTDTYMCQILNDGSFSACTVQSGFSIPIGVAFGY